MTNDLLSITVLLRSIVLQMLTVVESPIFQKLWPLYWDEDERAEFAVHIAGNPGDGVVIKGSGGLRKIRWSRPQAAESRLGSESSTCPGMNRARCI